MKINDFFSSSDLSLVTTISLFYPIDCVDRTDPSRIRFQFRRKEGIDQLIESFWRNELKISPLTYYNQLKLIKTRIYSKE